MTGPRSSLNSRVCAEDWSTRPSCARPDADARLWFSDQPAERKEARGRCGNCPARTTCLDRAMEAEGSAPARARFGIFGGLDGRQRYELYTTGRAAARAGRSGRPPAPCGTESAYQRHLRNSEPIDDACRQAHTTHRAKSRSRARK
ncbi:WhiB family transcriptional regulator [Streptomyces sp. NPDC051173]|uniref:WhiB family transcriptional regulator n=1 Tax=Streptomyces sp. NPDC051173 TaxID=3155164 RepID=UPI00344B6AB0